MGLTAGIVTRDNFTLDIDKKIAMSLADYYEYINSKPDDEIYRQFPEVRRLLKRIGRE